MTHPRSPESLSAGARSRPIPRLTLSRMSLTTEASPGGIYRVGRSFVGLMPSIRPHLTILRPSSTTVSFTVSTSSPSQSFASLVTIWLLSGLRVLLAALTLLILAAKYLHLHSSYLACIFNGLDLVPWPYVCTSAAVALFLVFRRFHTGMLSNNNHPTSNYYDLFSFLSPEENLLALRTLGIQTRSVSPYYLLPATTRFIPTSQVRDIFVHEAFRGFEVRYYLAIVVEGEAEVVVVFPVSLCISFNLGCA